MTCIYTCQVHLSIYVFCAHTNKHFILLLFTIILSTPGIAYAYINSWNSVYSNNWCNNVSVQLHEIGQ